MSRVAVVTGGSRGIGRAVCLEAARRGYDVLVCFATDAAAADAVVAEIRAAGRNAATHRADLADVSTFGALAAAARRLGPIGLLVNNAGLTLSAPLDAVTYDDWQRALALNLTAPTFLARLLAPDLAGCAGSIVNIGSTGGIVGSMHSLSYAATKAGLIGVTKTLARMLAPAVRVNLVAPGVTRTDLLDGITEEQLDAIAAGQLIERIGSPDEVAQAVLDVAGWTYATGQTVVVDGGRVMM